MKGRAVPASNQAFRVAWEFNAMTSNLVLNLSCNDRPGIVASVTTELAALGANIADSHQFWDRETGRFFMRIESTLIESLHIANT